MNANKKIKVSPQVATPLQLVTPREELLQRAIAITTSDRDKAYGNPEDNFKNIADLWTSYITAATGAEIEISPRDVSYMMILLKIARLSTNPVHYDSVLDIAGYAACAADLIVGTDK